MRTSGWATIVIIAQETSLTSLLAVRSRSSGAARRVGTCRLKRMFRPRLFGGIVAAIAISACHGSIRSPVPPAPKTIGSIAVTEVSDEEFGATVSRVLRSNEMGGKRSSLLAGIVRHQLRRAERLMRAGELDAGLRAVRGAIWLVRANEVRPDMWEGAARPLSEAAEEAARVGDEGKSRALYSLVKQAHPSEATVAAVDEHLAAMERFSQADAGNAELEAAGDRQRVAVQRSLYEPSRERLEDAGNKLVDWMRKALGSDVLERWGEASFDREEAIEAFRARRFGAMTMAGVFLRHGAPMYALDWLERNDLGRMLPSDLRDRLEQAGEDDEPRAWQSLYQHFQNEADPNRADSSIGIELAEAAAFGAAMALYRTRPKELASVGPLALMLPDVMLGDVVPSLVGAAMPSRISIEDASWSMSLVMRAMLAHGAVGDIEVARRLFAESRPLLDQATRLSKAGQEPRPHPARLYAVMASLEMHHADLGRAREDFQQAISLDPNPILYLDLGRVERQLDHADDAQKAISASIAAARKASDLMTEAEAQTSLYELESERGDFSAANAALRHALATVISARDRARQPDEQAQVERRFARILELYGNYDGAKRASSRALDASRGNHQQRTATIMDAARRALTHNDLRAARSALHDAVELGIGSTDCIYVALWVRLIERQQKVSGDGSVEEALSRIGVAPAWPGRLKAWVLGNVSDNELKTLAHSVTERTELQFYQTLALRNDRDLEVSRRELSEVARSPAVGLVEVSVAKDLLRLGSPHEQPRWPDEISVP
jgi:cellulose synthase operon protein C